MIKIKTMSKIDKLVKLFEQKFVAHPWHGVTIGENSPQEVKAYIEINSNDQIKSSNQIIYSNQLIQPFRQII